MKEKIMCGSRKVIGFSRGEGVHHREIFPVSSRDALESNREKKIYYNSLFSN